jgi:hypothetical protein
MITRRNFFGGLIATPAIVRLPSLMLMPRAPWPPVIRSPFGLACNGALLKVKDYPELFSVLGYTYGSGTGDRFCVPDIPNVPNMPGRLQYMIAAETGSVGPAGTIRIQVYD